jgi:hypothetical protein
MIPLDFLHVRPRRGIGKNDLSGSPGPQGPADPLEAQESAKFRGDPLQSKGWPRTLCP